MGGGATSPRGENTDISSKPRRRRRDGYFWQLIVLRIPAAVFAVAVIAYLVHYIRKWQGAIRRPEDADDPFVTRKDAGPERAGSKHVTSAPTHPAQRQDLGEAGDPEPLPNYKQSTGLEEIEPVTISADPPSYPEAVRPPPH
ncbi:hypothetical protein INS49_004527 [Diaporthe citri]|uniref:uncharacterized protein n=1 Tax=Diaporthe citri TaxID=83186 RepID=UPI001C8141B1|nr:uncharacterized protein INS49_004527 [Diaporthe citri]KAG6354510.1 hypothetical protein INS49_004527 [Diaporthe citri]